MERPAKSNICLLQHSTASSSDCWSMTKLAVCTLATVVVRLEKALESSTIPTMLCIAVKTIRKKTVPHFRIEIFYPKIVNRSILNDSRNYEPNIR